MKKLISLLFAAISIASCGMTKKVTTKTVTQRDTVIVKQHDTVSNTQTNTVTVYKHDTILVSGGEAVKETFTPDQLAPATTAKGVKMPHSYRIDTGALHIGIIVDTAGNVTITGNVDSIATVFANITDISREHTDSLNRSSVASTDKSDHTSAVTLSQITKIKIPLWGKLLALALVIGEIVIRLLKFYQQHYPKI